MGREPGHMQGRSVHDSAVVDGAKFDVAVAFPHMWANLTQFVARSLPPEMTNKSGSCFETKFCRQRGRMLLVNTED
jgi:hypothetical protein